MNEAPSKMSFRDVCRKLNIEDFSERIWRSNSHGELFHTLDYINFMNQIGDGDASWFRPLFLACVDYAEAEWKRPESCFQHMPRLMREMLEAANTKSA